MVKRSSRRRKGSKLLKRIRKSKNKNYLRKCKSKRYNTCRRRTRKNRRKNRTRRMKGGMDAGYPDVYRSDENSLLFSSRDSEWKDPARFEKMTDEEFKAEMEIRRAESDERWRGERQWEEMQKAKRKSDESMDPAPRVPSRQEKMDFPKLAVETYQMDLDAVRRARETEIEAEAAREAEIEAARKVAGEAERAAAPEPEPVTAPSVGFTKDVRPYTPPPLPPPTEDPVYKAKFSKKKKGPRRRQ